MPAMTGFESIFQKRSSRSQRLNRNGTECGFLSTSAVSTTDVADPEPTVAWPLSMIGSVSSYCWDSRRPSRWSSSAARSSSTCASSSTRIGNRKPRSSNDAISSAVSGSVRTSLTCLLLVVGKRDIARFFDACRTAERPQDDEVLLLGGARDPVRGLARDEADVACAHVEPFAADDLL